MEILLTVAIVLIVVLLYIIFNLLRKNEKLSSIINQLGVYVGSGIEELNEIDDLGFYKSDDSLGVYFRKIKEIYDFLNRFNVEK